MTVLNRVTARQRTLGTAAMVVLGLVVCGCASGNPASTAAAGRATRSASPSPSPSPTPITAAEHAWVAAMVTLQHKIDKPFSAHTMTVTREKEIQLSNAARRCGRELRRA